MPIKFKDLTIEEVKNFLDNTEIIVASVAEAGSLTVSLKYLPIAGEFRVYMDKEMVGSSKNLESIVDYFNTLTR